MADKDDKDEPTVVSSGNVQPQQAISYVLTENQNEAEDSSYLALQENGAPESELEAVQQHALSLVLEENNWGANNNNTIDNASKDSKDELTPSEEEREEPEAPPREGATSLSTITTITTTNGGNDDRQVVFYKNAGNKESDEMSTPLPGSLEPTETAKLSRAPTELQRQTNGRGGASSMGRPGAVAISRSSPRTSRPTADEDTTTVTSQENQSNTQVQSQANGSTQDVLVSAALVQDSDDLEARIEQLEEEKRHLEEQQRETAGEIPAATIVDSNKQEQDLFLSSPQKQSRVVLFVLLLIVAIIIAVVLVVVLKNNDTPNNTPTVTDEPTSAPSTPAPPAFNRTAFVLANVYPGFYYGNNNNITLDSNTWTALEWLANDDNDTSVLDENDRTGELRIDTQLLLERFALVKFYLDLNGQDWRGDAKWLSHEFGVCAWLGITCDWRLQVQGVKGGRAGLHGRLPSEIGLLTNVESVDWFQNSITGTIPTEIGLLTDLQYLYSQSNRLSGTLPTEMGLLTFLDFVNLDENCLTGTIPTELGSLPRLKNLQLSENNLQGDFNAIFCNVADNVIPPTIYSDCLLDEVACDCCQVCCDDLECRGDGFSYNTSQSDQC